MTTQNMVDNLKAQGFTVYGPDPMRTYAYFTDGTRVGYAQFSRMMGEQYYTVHVPNRYSGTGFEMRDAKEALAFAPAWATQSDRDSVIKYRDFEHFRSKHWQPLVQY